MNKTEKDIYFLLYTNCIPVKGISRSAIYDLQHNSIRLLPNPLFDVLKTNENKSIKQLKESFNNDYDKEIDSFFKELVDDDLGFFTTSLEIFPKLDLNWEYPGEIANAILVINEKSTLDYSLILNQLDGLGCTSLEVRFLDNQKIEQVESILKKCLTSRLTSIFLILQYSDEFNIENINLLLMKYVRVKKVIIHSANENKKYDENGLSVVHYDKNKINNSTCGQVCKDNFHINIPMFTETQKYNSCLNKKIAISETGAIKNCPSIDINYGNVKLTPIKEVISQPKFKGLWNIKKDDINVCMSCEFRYSCMDCRAYITEPDNIYSKPLKCSYNPITMIW